MRISTFTAIAALGLTASALPIDEKRQTNKFDECTNFGDEWCNDGEVLTCKQVPFTDQGWVKSTHKTCSSKRKTEKFDKCFNYGEEWCNDGEILTCKKVPFVDQGRVKSTHKTCASKRGVGDYCNKIGVTWCQDYQVLTCSEYRITPTGAGCSTKRSVEVEERGWKPDITIPTLPIIPKPNIPKPVIPTPPVAASKRDTQRNPIIPPVIVPPMPPVVPKPVIPVPPKPFDKRGWKPDINIPSPPEIPKPNIPEPDVSIGRRDVGDPCGFVGFVWCQDYQIYTCTENNRIEPTGGSCNTKRSADAQKNPIIPPVIIPPVAPVIPKPVIPTPPTPPKPSVPREVEVRGWKPDINVPAKPEIPKPEIPGVPKPQVTKPAKRDIGDRCDKAVLEKTWCQDFEILQCVSVEGQGWGMIVSTGVGCST
ncbi:hypothetical protein EK21DRAFT_89641 [Setomelanomma holmii]|uniref:Uncharacterized protein n=1 Tax=Setomelanomma holmii TaxID=210430 RepID=A0A9P4H7A8_9PLEO|nr:hypothetical protein EK21DRAFT_89641 [Setomelanomma holmii]